MYYPRKNKKAAKGSKTVLQSLISGLRHAQQSRLYFSVKPATASQEKLAKLSQKLLHNVHMHVYIRESSIPSMIRDLYDNSITAYKTGTQ